jgi:hypothetical protein
MAFKLPQEPIRNRKEFLTYLLATACGVTLALSLERAGEWWKMRSLVKEARHNLALEITDTRAQLATWRKQVVDMQRNLENVSDYTEEMIAKGSTDRRELTIGIQFPGLTSAAWRAAEASGAAGHMSYAEIKQYAQFYTLQADWERIHQVSLDEMSPLMAFFQRKTDPTKNQRREDMEHVGRDVRAMMMRLKIMDSLAGLMDKLGGEILSKKD